MRTGFIKLRSVWSLELIGSFGVHIGFMLL